MHRSTRESWLILIVHPALPFSIQRLCHISGSQDQFFVAAYDTVWDATLET